MGKKLVILGGGYGGMRLIQGLLPKIRDDHEIILIDRLPYHTFKVEYYALAAGTESLAELTHPFPEDPRLTKIYGEATSIDFEGKRVEVREHDPIEYDELVIAVGCVDDYQNVLGAEENAFSIQTIKKSQIASQRLTTLDPYERVMVIGGGLSGVELAAELRQSRPDLNISIVNRGKGLLSPFPQKTQDYVTQWFREHDVNLINYIQLNELYPQYAIHQEGTLEYDAVVWTAGIKPAPITDCIVGERDHQARFIVGDDYSLPEQPDVYIIGDCASANFAPSAYLAEMMADRLRDILLAKWKGQAIHLPPLKLKAVFGSLGKKEGFAVIGDTPLHGRVPRILKSGVLWLYKRHLG
ncbi:NAD(P)/FAD-dependent oxidoreductase [Ammoniphilus sp. CFH 90114]|uniref:NAD(P)/FAD-dependent oxidoreductase n=1 Tax=Ammoniphilus sp. CFH 90114 TaxID=2493665 RepID=UPI00100F407B|nr:FAD-dependent oxidoreductase [Ammoniphilus sp. CFH 90114]RXT14939.1 NAD(P)/FAD-dependent oxidoreductase [Ammoniphilus sp. CFH 90114]